MDKRYPLGQIAIVYLENSSKRVLLNNYTGSDKIEYQFILLADNESLYIAIPVDQKLNYYHDWILNAGAIKNIIAPESDWAYHVNIKSYVDRKGSHLRNEHIIRMFDTNNIQTSLSDGTHCAQCNEWVPYQSTGYTCFQCRQDKYRFKF